MTKVCGRDGCEVEFEIPPKWRGAPKKYCSEGCRTAAYQKRAYWAKLEASRAKGRRKYEKHAEARRAKSRRYYQEHREEQIAKAIVRQRARRRRIAGEQEQATYRDYYFRARELELAKASAEGELLQLIEEQQEDERRRIITKPWEISLNEPRRFGDGYGCELIDLIAA